MAPSEHQLQVAFFQWARLHPLARRAYAIPNGGQRNIVVATKLKAEGVRSSVLDIHLPLARGGAHGLWIEMKAGKGQPTAGQAEEAQQLVKDGYAVAVCWSTEAAIETTQSYLRGDLGPALLISARPSAGAKRPARPKPSAAAPG